jgi:hypothetical protein
MSQVLKFGDEARAAEVLAGLRARAARSELPPPYVPSTPPLQREPGCDDGDETPTASFTNSQIREPAPPGDDEPHTGSPEDIGFIQQRETSHATAAGKAGHPPLPAAGDCAPPAAAPHHLPKPCRSCGAPVFWAQVVDSGGVLVRKENGRPQALPVDAEPTPDGNVVLRDREGSITAYVLKKREQPPAGAKTRKAHHATCPQASSWRGHR